MPATITSQFRKNNSLSLITSAQNSPIVQAFNTGTFYIGIGKSDSWASDTNIDRPGNSRAASAEALGNLIMLRRIADAKMMFPANAFQSGRIYKYYDPTDDSCFYGTNYGTGVNAVTHHPCYVTGGPTSGNANRVYICLYSNLLSTTAEPVNDSADNNSIGVVINAGSYKWSYLYTISGESSLNTSTFKPLTTLGYSPGVTMTATLGKIFKIRIIEAGTGYLSNTSIILNYSISGTNTNNAISLTHSVDSITGKILSVDAPSDVTFLNYTISHASITILHPNHTGAVAKLIPLLTPVDGIARDLTKVLPCWYAGFYAKFDPNTTTSESGKDLIITNDYRQISLVKNPLSNSVSVTAGLDNYPESVDSIDCLSCFKIPSDIYINPALFKDGGTVTQCTNIGTTSTDSPAAAIGYVDYARYVTIASNVINDATSATAGAFLLVYFHQNYNCNFSRFADSTLTGNTYTYIKFNITSLQQTYYSYTAIIKPEYTQGTGEVLFLENRLPITRTSSQVEEIKLIIQL